jgi:3-dehydrosphinganine reductase
MFYGKDIVITGASQGVGRAIAGAFAGRGANVMLVARGEAGLDAAVSEMRGLYPDVRIESHACDVSNYEDVSAAVDRTVELFGGIDGVVNNAGVAVPRYFDDIPPDEFERVMRINYLGSVYPTKAALPHLKRGSFIAFTSSVAGYLGAFGYTSYAPSKFAQIGFAESLEQEVRPRGIRVAVLCPPDTQTPGFDEENKTKPFETKYMAGAAKLLPAEKVAECFLDGLERGTFLINCNAESSVIYRLKGAAPGLSRWIMHRMVAKALRKMKDL